MKKSNHPLRGLRWTTRDQVCDELLQYLEQTASEASRVDSDAEARPGLAEEEIGSPWETPAMLRPRVAQLFALLAEERHIPLLRQLHLEYMTDYPIGSICRDTLVRLKAPVPLHELRALLEAEYQDSGWVSFGLFPELFRSPEAQAVAREVMESWTAAQRAASLSRMGWHASLHGLANWLYERWLNEERWQLGDVADYEGPLNQTVARYTASRHNLNRPESKAVLLEYWRRAEGEEREKLRDCLWDFDDGVPAAWVADRPEELRELAEGFVLGHADLASYYGAERLLEIAAEELRETSRRLRAGPEDYSTLEARKARRMEALKLERAVALLADWPEPGVRERIRSLIACPDIETEVRWAFCDHLWQERHQEMVALALAAAQSAGDHRLALRVLRWLADEPQPADRPLLWWAAFQETDWELPYWALQSLEQLGESSEAWQERLRSLSQSPHPLLRLQAGGALARRGETERLDAIARVAAEDEDPCVRGEAIRVLGQLGAVGHLNLIRRAVWAEGPVYKPDPEGWDSHVPAAEEAVLALARLGTPEALTALIEGFLFLPPHTPPQGWVHDAAEDALGTAVARMNGDRLAFGKILGNTWRWEYFKPWPEPSFKLAE